MHPLNPFLRAFFRSVLPSQCVPVQNHILLVPTTESLIGSRDRDSNIPYSDLVASEEFLGSHVLRISNSSDFSTSKDVTSIRESKGKARQITTVNGRTVVVKESSVYSNKGFKSLNQAQLVSDVLYFSYANDAQSWLIYYISKPLLGTFDSRGIIQAVVPDLQSKGLESTNHEWHRGSRGSNFTYKGIESFGELLTNFPMIARQMKPGLERLFREFGKELGKPLPPPPSRSPPLSIENSNGDETTSIWSNSSASQRKLPFNSSKYFEDDEELMRRALETAVTAAIDLFRLVDQQQLSLLGATTELTGPVVERLIERYVSEQVHDSLLFPRLCDSCRTEDLEVDACIRQMENIDVSQVGIAIEDGRKGKVGLIQRLGKGIDEFRKLVAAKCPQDMLITLLATFKIVTACHDVSEPEGMVEKERSVLTINADVLVSLLVLIITRSQIRHLHARLLYMQHYIFIDDVESGESGYALSTFEAVLTYIRNNSNGLRRASARNKRLWMATKLGRVSEMKSILEPNAHAVNSLYDKPDDEEQFLATSDGLSEGEISYPADSSFLNGSISVNLESEPQAMNALPETPGLSHVFPFQRLTQDNSPNHIPKSQKKVSMDTRSMSESSTMSYLSCSTAQGSVTSGIEGDTSIQSLTKTQGPAGDSIPMMAVEECQPESLKYLLSLDKFYPREVILEDTNNDGTTLLSAAVQLGHTQIVDIILDFIFQECNDADVTAYFSKADARGRTVAHYLFSIPSLMSRLGNALPWKLRDKNGQTPLFALSRSYDHPDYISMVNGALSSAQKSQGDGRLRLEDHVDARGNTLLHIISDPELIARILNECDCDPNATNDKRFTPLMMASKYGRIDLVRTFFADPRVDVYLREIRGLTAVELAKDDEVRNKIDDLVLFSNPPSSSLDSSGRTTTVVRSLFVEDASMRFIIKSGARTAPAPNQALNLEIGKGALYTVTTCRRSINDFNNLVRLLKLEHPASYIPDLPSFRSPLQIPSKPSRAVLHDIQGQLDRLLKTLLAHPTFSTHELLWEFFLVPEMQTEIIEERSIRKAAVLRETIMDDYQPVTTESIRDIEQIISHAQDAVGSVGSETGSVIRCGHLMQHATTDFTDALLLCGYALSSLQSPTNALPLSHAYAFNRFASCFSISSEDSSPLIQYLTALTSAHGTTSAILSSLSRPNELLSILNSTKKALARSHSTIASSSLPRKFNFSVLEESRQRSIREEENKITVLMTEMEEVGKELSWNKDVVVGELAGWTSWREQLGRRALHDFVKTSLIREKERGKRMERCLASLQVQS